MPILEVLSAKLESHITEDAVRDTDTKNDLKDIRLDIKEIRSTLIALDDNKVSFKHFYWIIGILMAILMSVLGFIVVQINALSTQMNDVHKTSAVTQTDVSYLKEKLSPMNVQYVK